MPYTVPTRAEFRTYYPEFASSADGVIDRQLLLAQLFVDTTWLESDYAPAIAALAAHLLSLEQAAIDKAASGTTTTASGAETYVRSLSFGDRAISYGVVGGSASSGEKSALQSTLGETSYGQLFKMLLRRNGPHVLVA